MTTTPRQLINLVRFTTGRRIFTNRHVRQAAVAVGLHEVLLQAMEDHRNKPDQAMDIWMMSQELLVGTNYQGEIPTILRR